MKYFHDVATPAEGAAKLDPLAPTDRRGVSQPTQKGDETLDALFHGKVKLFQSRRGYRFPWMHSCCGALLSRSKARESAIDLGTGNGVIPLIWRAYTMTPRSLASRSRPAMAGRAARNVRLNQLESQIHIRLGDIREVDAIAPAASFDMAVCNPPYRRAASGRISPNDEKRIARHESRGALGDFLRAADFFLRARGRITVVYLAERAVDLFAAMRAARLEPKRSAVLFR
jgi:tRNA1Val (adenine37-N6)-methyltransferase